MAKALVAFREGDRSEYLAQSVFSTIGFVVPVARQEDRFLTDLVVQLNIECKDATPPVVEPTGLSIAVQVKSNYEPIAETHDPAAAALVAAFGHQPWFVAVVEKKTDSLSVYSTLQRHFWRNVTGFSIALEAAPHDKASRRPRTVYVGPPVVRAGLRELDSENGNRRARARQRFRETMLSWARLDATNIAYRTLGIPAILLPRSSWQGGLLRDEDTQLHFIIDQVEPERVMRGTALAVQAARICLQRVGVNDTSALTRTNALREMRELGTLLEVHPVIPDVLTCSIPMFPSQAAGNHAV
ncbi:MAG: hypothetical protein KF902_05930 [Phycisphaeraceae bacterium]|nr:hypothetical protein [Phycisphaeraceae bacterium]